MQRTSIEFPIKPVPAASRGHRAVIPRDASVRRAGVVAHVGCGLEAFEWAFARRIPVSQRNLAPFADPELGAQDVGMGLGGARRDSEPLGDLEVRAPLGDQFHHLPLALREPNAFAESDHAAMVPADRLKRY